MKIDLFFEQMAYTINKKKIEKGDFLKICVNQQNKQQNLLICNELNQKRLVSIYSHELYRQTLNKKALCRWVLFEWRQFTSAATLLTSLLAV